jgi:hypothetical protein
VYDKKICDPSGSLVPFRRLAMTRSIVSAITITGSSQRHSVSGDSTPAITFFFEESKLVSPVFPQQQTSFNPIYLLNLQAV